jgi:transcriptional regulator with XRE-family HTH domain
MRGFAPAFASHGRKQTMGRPFRSRTLQELDEMLLAYRMSRPRMRAVASWLRSIRQATGVPVEEIRRKLGVTKWEVFRLEQSEANERIQLSSLRNAARGLDCELVYALVPRHGSLAEMAAKAREDREERQREQLEARAEKLKPWLEWAGARELLIDGLRKSLQRYYGVRVRGVRRPPSQRQVREALKKAEEAVRLARLASRAERSVVSCQ